MSTKGINSKLQALEDGILGVNNNPEIAGMMSNFGYTSEKMEEGSVLLEKARATSADQVEFYSDFYIAKDGKKKKVGDVYGSYMITVKVVRIAFKGKTELLTRFKATGRRRKSFSGWLGDAGILYTNLLKHPESLAVMAKFGYSVEKLQQEQEMLKEVQAYHSQQLVTMGNAQQSTVDRDSAFDAACDWYSDFRGIARIALYEKPQLLEALGIIAKN